MLNILSSQIFSLAKQYQGQEVNMALNSTDHLPPGVQHSCIHRIDEGMIPRDAHQTTRRGQEDAQEKRTIVISLPAINKKQQIKENEKKRKMKQETECEKTKEVAENQNEEESEEEHWSHNFAKQLIEMNEGHIPTHEQQITMIPNPFFSDFFYL